MVASKRGRPTKAATDYLYRLTQSGHGRRLERRESRDLGMIAHPRGRTDNPPPVAECLLCKASKNADAASLCPSCRTEIDKLWEVVK